MRNLGCFVSCAGGLENGVKNGEALGVNTIMIHATPPQRWNSKPFEEDKMKAFKDAIIASEIVNTVHMHGIYLINLANPDKQKWHLSKVSIGNYLELAEYIDSPGVVFHTGSFKDIEPDEGFERVIKGIDWICENANSSKPLFLECAAGAGKVIGSKFEHLARIRDGVKDKSRVQFCLDTQHMWASGYDILNDLDGVVDQMEKILGLENVRCVHFNDSKTELGSNRDRHENLGEGLIGEKGMKGFLNHPKLKGLDFVMETPNLKDMETAPIEVKKLQSWAE
ncbi:deoxyribonuclease IV [Candidatus Dojkabacteria bacterium]|uniref:Probable endonuclease 4 n=1 Tax=Candidatus Dojkabacteria bacterium TaxID=2099670 RepID=A0A955LAB4_9BACT|nr:deoxyribonuclease IV [Candidatus Dojkabacteria bacterium]